MTDVSLLNKNQKEAVLSEAKYIRVIAGAGSGKTRVLTMRIIHLIEDCGMFASRILAITFTNKAANEMKERVSRMLEDQTYLPRISTIHSLCVRILREDIEVMDYPRNYTIMDADDQKAVLKEAYKQLNLDTTSWPYGSMIDYISNNKAADISIEKAYEIAGDYSADKTRAKVYEYYLNRQRDLLALDFDDLILWTVRMFRRFPQIRKKWQDRLSCVLVDEFQDIDALQYELIRLLAGEDSMLYVVGDPDQTIYTWRGADVNIIMNFSKDYPDAETIILNENYRSTNMILNGANSVIANNRSRMKKDLFTNREGDDKITHCACAADDAEAAWVAGKVSELHRKGKSYLDMAVLYRSNYLSRSLEKAMLDARIPYIIYGGIRFYERKEIKDALCYLRMAVSADDLALQRVINVPRRGIGNKTMDMIADSAREQEISMYEVLKQDQLFSGKVRTTLQRFTAMVEKWRAIAMEHTMEIDELFETILTESGYKAMLEEAGEHERIENLKELVDDIEEFCENNPDSGLDEYLQVVALYGDREESASADYLQLMTVHAAKGLEFDTVFVTDMNDGIFPNERAMSEGSRGVEEERRLAYVAFTRARNKLYLMEAGGYSYILQRVRTTSRFIKEIDPACIEHIGLTPEPSRSEARLSSLLFDNDTAPFAEKLAKTKTPLLKKGEMVTHTKFGEGVVIKCVNGIAEIAFPYPHGIKKIASGHPTLKRKK
ncbi:MAG: UvrD-helicase domain-containing protein [Solobacterium sp.]|nr:UvrD-helicase domain-containing protein [Solobacterium sp.]